MLKVSLPPCPAHVEVDADFGRDDVDGRGQVVLLQRDRFHECKFNVRKKSGLDVVVGV